MTERYRPNIQEASIPDDGGWAEIEKDPVLLLSIPEWKDIIHHSSEEYQSVWMYDRMEDAYLFCFKLAKGVEKAIAFPKEHAGLLLQDEHATRTFSMLITCDTLEETGEESPCLYFQELTLRRHPKAGW